MGASIGIQVFQTGVTVASTVTSSTTALPTLPNNAKYNYIRVTASAETYVRIGAASVVATVNDSMVQPADSLIMSVNGATHIACIQGPGPTNARVNIVAIENL